MIDRRKFLGIAGASLALTPRLLRVLSFQQSGASLIQRAIPSSGAIRAAVHG